MSCSAVDRTYPLRGPTMKTGTPEPRIDRPHTMLLSPTAETPIQVNTLTSEELAERLPHLGVYVCRNPQVPLSRMPAWLAVLAEGLRHTTYCLEAEQDGRICGMLPLAYVRSLLF